jgi:hypothetical protein
MECKSGGRETRLLGSSIMSAIHTAPAVALGDTSAPLSFELQHAQHVQLNAISDSSSLENRAIQHEQQYEATTIDLGSSVSTLHSSEADILH